MSMNTQPLQIQGPVIQGGRTPDAAEPLISSRTSRNRPETVHTDLNQQHDQICEQPVAEVATPAQEDIENASPPSGAPSSPTSLRA